MTENSTEPSSGADKFSYDVMRDAIENNVTSEADREVLIASMEHLQAVQGTEAFTSAYEHFVQSAENHLPVLERFLTSLSEMLGA